MRTELRRLLGGVFVYGIGEVLNRVISFLLLPVFTAYLTPKDYGISGILGLIVFLAIPVFSLGFGTALGAVYFESGDGERRDAAIWTSFMALAASVGLMLGLGWWFDVSLSVSSFGEAGYERLILLSLLSGGCTILAQPFRLRLQFEERAKLYVALSAASTFISIVASIVMVVVLKRGIAGFVEGGLIGQAVTLFLFGGAVMPTIRFAFSRPLMRQLLKIGFATIPGFFFLFVLQQGNRYFLRWSDGLDAVGIYTIGYNLGFAMNVFVSGFTSAWTPYFLSFTERKEEARSLFGSILSYYVLGFGTLSLLFFAAARPVVMIMTQPAFHDAYLVVGLTAAAQVLIGVFSIALAPVYFAKEVPRVTYVQAVAAVFAVAITAVCTQWWGAFGAGVSLTLGFLSMALLQFGWNRLRGERYFRPENEWSRIGRFALFYLFAASLLLFPRDFSIPDELMFDGIAAAAIIAIVGLVFVRPAERAAGVQLIRAKLGAGGR